MGNLLDGIEEILLMGPGPSCVNDKVYEALGKKTLGHLDPYFIRILSSGPGTVIILGKSNRGFGKP